MELPKRIAENIEQFTGRTWLLPKLLDWWEKDQERLFLLTGGPGTGKSMILAWLAGFGPEPKEAMFREQLLRLRAVVKAGHFCQAASRNITPQAFAESVANQLTATVNGFEDALAATLAERVQIVAMQTVGTIGAGGSATNVAIARIDLGNLGDELSFDRAFIQPLKKLYTKGYDQPILLLVDALDEADTYTGVKIPDLLSRLSDLPAPIHILATTRDEPRVLKFFRSAKRLDLITDGDPAADDVRTYAEGRLIRLTEIEDSKRRDFAKRLSAQANGVFLYTAMVLDELLERPPSQLPDLATYPLPNGLGGIYHDFLTRELGKDEQRWFDLYEPLLGLIAVAQGDGLTTQQLTEITGKDIRRALRACKQYLSGELPDGPFRPFHKSLAEFLLEDKTNLDYHIDSQVMHQRIANHYWSKHRQNWTHADQYALAHIAMHLGMVQAWPLLERLLLDISFVRAASDFSNEALADSYRWANACLERMAKGPSRELLLQVTSTADGLRSFIDRAAEIDIIEKFLASEDQQHLLILGGPGTGKSFLSKLVWIRHFDQCLLAKLGPGDSLFKKLMEVVRDSPLVQEHVSREENDFIATLPFSDAYRYLFNLVARCNRVLCFIIDELDIVPGVDYELRELPPDFARNLRFIWVSRSMGAPRHLVYAATVVNLDRLSETAVLDLCRQRLGHNLSENLLERIAAASHGSPLLIDLVAQQFERNELSKSKLETLFVADSIFEVYEDRMSDLEACHRGIRERLGCVIRAMVANEHHELGVMLNNVGVQFDSIELESMEASGFFVIERENAGNTVRVSHASMLEFLCRRYGLG